MELSRKITSITKIPRHVLVDCDIFGESIAGRMSWAANRQTTRLEDMAYCLLGIFNINMPLLYGEGLGAFQRLQQEIIKISDDETIFTWTAKSSTHSTWRSLFAESPSEFANSGQFVPYRHSGSSKSEMTMMKDLKIQLILARRNEEEDGWSSDTEFIAYLDCRVNSLDTTLPVGIFVKRVQTHDYVRVDVDRLVTMDKGLDPRTGKGLSLISVRQRLDYATGSAHRRRMGPK